jgi:NADH pyrophosphatase NudC (nudix superfamily)
MPGSIIFGAVALLATVLLVLWVKSTLSAKGLRETADTCRIEAQNLAHDKTQIKYAISRAVELINQGRAKEARNVLMELGPEFKHVCGACARAEQVPGCRFCPVCGKPVQRSKPTTPVKSQTPRPKEPPLS